MVNLWFYSPWNSTSKFATAHLEPITTPIWVTGHSGVFVELCRSCCRAKAFLGAECNSLSLSLSHLWVCADASNLASLEIVEFNACGI